MTGTMLAKLKYIRRERDGRLYVRRNGRSIRLRSALGTPEFYAEYAAALEQAEKPKQSKPAAAGTLKWLCQRYMALSSDFKAMRPSSQAVRRRTLEAICAKHGHKPYRLMEDRHVRAIRDEKAGKPEAQNTRIKALRGLFKWAVEEKLMPSNPARDIGKVRYQSDGYHTWTLDEVAAYEARWPSGTKQRLALALLLYTGARRSDVVRLGRQMVRDGWLTFKAVKNGAEISLPVLPELQAEIDKAPKDNLTFLVTEYGKPFSAAGFGIRFRKWCDEAGLPHCTAHGLRKAGAARAAEKGASEAHLNAIFGWGENSLESRRYTRAARRKVLAAEAVRLLGEQKTVPKIVPGTKTDKKAKKINA